MEMEISHSVRTERGKKCQHLHSENPYNVVGILPEDSILSSIDRMLYFFSTAALCLRPPTEMSSIEGCASPIMETARSNGSSEGDSTDYAETAVQSLSNLPSDQRSQCHKECQICETQLQNIIMVPDQVIHSPEEPFLSSIDRVLYLLTPRCKPSCHWGDEQKIETIDAKTLAMANTNLNTEKSSRSSRHSDGAATDMSLDKNFTSVEPKRSGACTAPKRFSCSSGELQQRKKFSLNPLRKTCSTNLLNNTKFDFSQPICNTKWSWTRITTFMDGSKIYEVFDHVPLAKPKARLLKTQPKMIFAVLPNGIAIPFKCV